MLVNKETNKVSPFGILISLQTLFLRSKIISYIRNFLIQRDFIEVETPILSTSAGGAMATPFTTRAVALDEQLQLRIAPELYLKVQHKLFHLML
jgi:lysyl-tRNA synthetase class 2